MVVDSAPRAAAAATVPADLHAAEVVVAVRGGEARDVLVLDDDDLLQLDPQVRLVLRLQLPLGILLHLLLIGPRSRSRSRGGPAAADHWVAAAVPAAAAGVLAREGASRARWCW